MFLLGLFIIAIVILRMALGPSNWNLQNRCIWGHVECFSLTLVANVPIMHSLWPHGFGKLHRCNFVKENRYEQELRAQIQRSADSIVSEHGLALNCTQPGSPSRRDRARQSVSLFKLISSSLGIEQWLIFTDIDS